MNLKKLFGQKSAYVAGQFIEEYELLNKNKVYSAYAKIRFPIFFGWLWWTKKFYVCRSFWRGKDGVEKYYYLLESELCEDHFTRWDDAKDALTSAIIDWQQDYEKEHIYRTVKHKL